MRRLGIAAVVAAATVGAPVAAHAFCGFYINGAGGEMFNNATQVVLMRQGTRTVRSVGVFLNPNAAASRATRVELVYPGGRQTVDLSTGTCEGAERLDA